MKKSITILGAGAVGSMMAIMFAKYQKAEVRLWDIESDLIFEIKETHQNQRVLNSQIEFPERILLFTNLEEALGNSDLVVLAVPTFALRDLCEKLTGFSLPPVMTVAKGMEKKTLLLPSQIVQDVLSVETLHFALVGFAKEMARGVPANGILSAEDSKLTHRFKNLFDNPLLNFEISGDFKGIQLAGALKNVLAISMGIIGASSHYFQKKRDKLIEEGVKEMKKLGRVMEYYPSAFAREGGLPFEGVAGKKDLVISSTPSSRNYLLGNKIYQNGIEKVKKELEENNMTVEGFNTSVAVNTLARRHYLNLPMMEKTYQVVYEGLDPEIVAEELTTIASR